VPHSYSRRHISTLLIAGWLALPPYALPKPPRKADLSLKDLNGKPVRLQELRGRIVVLNFWATWCGPCKEELPLMVKTSQEYSGRDVLFIGASLDESKTSKFIPGFIDKYGITFPIWTGASADDLDRLKMGPGVPATAFVDRDGQIVSRVSGEIRPDELKQIIDWLLSDRKEPAPEAFVDHLEGH
jgi:thiol-disulfide isomerase/thioredoxin